MTKQYPET